MDAAAIRDLMWRNVGLFRTADGLKDAAERLNGQDSNLAIVARLIARAALRREESRGAHYRADFPDRGGDRWRVHRADQLE